MLILDVKDRANPKLLATYDYVPPFHGGNLGAAHTSLPVVTRQGEHPDLVVQTDEIFDCPPGFGRILDVSDVKNPEVVKGDRPANVVLLSTFRFDSVSDKFDPQRNVFVCDTDGPGGRSGTTTHLPVLDQRSPSLVYINWYDEGVRAMDISNPFALVFVDMLPTYFGDSVGRWEGDTLVVDVAGFNGKTWLADARDKPTPTSLGIWFHSDALHVVERWRLLDADTLEYQAVVEDPKMLTRPWKTQKTVKRQPFTKIGEGMCFDTTTYDLAQTPKK